jgi:AcrR family transcriptional regulator
MSLSPPSSTRRGTVAEPAPDPLREQLLAATCEVFASKGYDGTKLMDIVRASGLSSGAVYGRFTSKDELLLAAVIEAVERDAIAMNSSELPVAEALAEASRADQPLDDHEAMRLEAFIAARRKPTLATAIADARERWRATIADPLIERASSDGSASPHADFDSIIYLVHTLRLGLLVQRGAGQYAPDSDAWRQLMERLLRSMAHPQADVPPLSGDNGSQPG